MMGDLSVALMVVVLSRRVLISELIKLYKYVQLFIYRSYLNKVVLKIRRIEKRRTGELKVIPLSWGREPLFGTHLFSRV